MFIRDFTWGNDTSGLHYGGCDQTKKLVDAICFMLAEAKYIHNALANKQQADEFGESLQDDDKS